MMNTNSAAPLHGELPVLARGTRVYLPDGTIAYASPDRRMGAVWGGTYYTRQGGRIDTGWRREQLVVLI